MAAAPHFVNYDTPLCADFASLPQILLTNLNSLPKLFKKCYPEAYLGADVDIHMQLACTCSVILNKKIPNIHSRIEFVDFPL